jgi:hypothetical protein
VLKNFIAALSISLHIAVLVLAPRRLTSSYWRVRAGSTTLGDHALLSATLTQILLVASSLRPVFSLALANTDFTIRSTSELAGTDMKLFETFRGFALRADFSHLMLTLLVEGSRPQATEVVARNWMTIGGRA